MEDTLSEDIMVNVINDFVNHMLRYTVRLTEVNDKLDPSGGIASGVILRRNNSLYLLSAGHCFRSHGPWIIETDIQTREGTFSFTVPEVVLISEHNIEEPGNEKPLDVAWAELDMDAIRKQLATDKNIAEQSIIVPWYEGPIDENPVPTEAYGFASYSKTEYHEFSRILRREAIYEYGMKFIRVNPDGLYEFRLSREHQGHSYYRGTSGSPIADPTGKIVSIVVGGSMERNLIFGFPISKIANLIEL